MNSGSFPSQYQRLKEGILSLGLARPGSLITRFMPCGKSPCRCTASPPRLHGPYWEWSTKQHGKSVTRRMTKEQARLCRAWQRNHRKLKKILHRMEALSLKESDRLLGKAPPRPGKPSSIRKGASADGA